MGRVTEHVLVAVMLLTALQSALGQTAATAENQETESSPLETDRKDQDPLVQQFTASVSQLQQQCQSYQQTLSEQMSEQMSELEKKSLSRQDTLSKQMSEQMSELRKESKSHQETLSKQMSEQMSELEEKSLSRQDTLSKQMSELQKESLSYREDLVELTLRIDRLLQEQSLNHQDTFSKQMSEQMSQLQKESLSYREELTLRIDRLLQERSVNHQGDLAELTRKIDRLPRDLSNSAGSSDTCQSPCRTSCKDWKRFNPRSGVRTVHLCQDPITVYCDQTTDNGGWTVFQRRVDASVDFYRGWEDYRKGFGDLEGNFWLGLDNLHSLTTSQSYELRVDLEKWDGTKGHATYSGFYVDGASNNFTMHYDRFTGGNAGNSLDYHRGRPFSTKDRDNHVKCAQFYLGAWWYKHCFCSNLNGEYKANSSAPGGDGISWRTFGGSDRYSMKFSEMKIRPM